MGQGLAKAALTLLPDLARELGLVRLEALVETSNHPSQAVCKAAGFTEEGTLRSYYRIGNEQRDMIMLAHLLPQNTESPYLRAVAASEQARPHADAG